MANEERPFDIDPGTASAEQRFIEARTAVRRAETLLDGYRIELIDHGEFSTPQDP